jgi:protein-S-isoprenylcysteine O-methyltransferase Ste14
MGRRVFAVIRAFIVAPVFISFWLYFVPRWIAGPQVFADPRPIGWLVLALGAVIGLPCVWEFAWRGLGTPAPFDPPRKLVVTGPYRFVRNPMYLGMGLAIIGEAIVFPHATLLLLVMMVIMWGFVSAFVIAYEEPTLRRLFGADYENYCRSVHRWLPRLRPYSTTS